MANMESGGDILGGSESFPAEAVHLGQKIVGAEASIVEPDPIERFVDEGGPDYPPQAA